MRKREVTSWRPVTLAALTLKFPIVPLEIFKPYVNNDKQESVSIWDLFELFANNLRSNTCSKWLAESAILLLFPCPSWTWYSISSDLLGFPFVTLCCTDFYAWHILYLTACGGSSYPVILLYYSTTSMYTSHFYWVLLKKKSQETS